MLRSATVAVAVVAAVALISDPPTSSLLCVPHECLGMELEPEVQRGLLADVRRELDALPRSVGVGSDERGGDGERSGGDNPAPSYSGFRNDSTALLITVGGPPRAESIVQAHVLIKLVREHHGESAAQLPIEVWHAGEAGMPQACEVWARLFGVVCHDTWQTAHEGGRLAHLIGLPSNGDGGDGGGDGGGANGWEKGQGGATTEPPLEWVRGWPIKPLVLLLTRWDRVVMVDADSIPLAPVHELAASLLANLASGAADGGGGGGGGGVCGGDGGAVFWPDITPLGAGHATMRKALDLPPTSEGEGDGSAEPLSAESGQIVVDRYKSWDALRIAWVLNAHPVVYTLLHGDKDTYRLAWEFAGLPYYQISHPPLALGGLGPQEMVDGSTAMASSGPSGFCGQALLQRNIEGEALFVHRVLSKYNIMNLLTTDSWGWTAPLIAREANTGEAGSEERREEQRGGAGLVQRGWCIEVEDSTQPAAAGHVPQEVRWARVPQEALALAKRAVEARMDMAGHF